MPKTHYLWDYANDSLLMETDENHDPTAVYTVEPEPFGKVISQRRDSVSSYHQYDALGSTRQLTDVTGNVTDTNLYDAWGVDVASTGTTKNPFRWVGELGYYWDAEIVQYYVRARMFSPNVASWTSIDPLDLFNNTREQYKYASLSPVTLVDPSGHVVLSYSNCSATQRADIMDADAAVTARLPLIIADLAKHGSIWALQWATDHKRSHSMDRRAVAKYDNYWIALRANFDKTHGKVVSGYHACCKKATEGSCPGNTAYTLFVFGFIPRNTVFFCPDYFATLPKRAVLAGDGQDKKLLHELTHIAASTNDAGIAWFRAYVPFTKKRMCNLRVAMHGT